MVYSNYLNGIISQEVWEKFIIDYNKKIQEYENLILNLKKQFPIDEE